MAYEPPFIPDEDQRIISIDNDGLWERGGTYEVTWYSHYWAIRDGFPFLDYVHTLAPQVEPDEFAPPFNETEFIFTFEENADAYGHIANTFLSWGTTYFDYQSNNLIYPGITATSSLFNDEVYEVDGDSDYHRYTNITTFTVAENAQPGSTYRLLYLGHKRSTDGPLVTEIQRELTTITILGNPNRRVVQDRPAAYNENAVWDPILGTWVAPADLETLGGGRYNNRLIVIGHKAIYFGDI